MGCVGDIIEGTSVSISTSTLASVSPSTSYAVVIISYCDSAVITSLSSTSSIEYCSAKAMVIVII